MIGRSGEDGRRGIGYTKESIKKEQNDSDVTHYRHGLHNRKSSTGRLPFHEE